MADLSRKDSSSLVSIVGADSSGAETNFAGVDSFQRLLVSVEKSEPPTFNVVARGVNLANNKSMMSIVNTSSTAIYVKEVWLTMNSGTNYPNSPVNFELKRITGHSGGTSVVPWPHDSQDSVPSGVTAAHGATVSGESSSIIDSTYWGSTENAFGTDSEAAIVEFALNNQFPFWSQTPGTKALVLRQNEGLTIKCATNVNDTSFTLRIVFTT